MTDTEGTTHTSGESTATRAVSVQDLEEFKEKILSLYLKHKLEVVQDIMKRSEGIYATPKQYRKALAGWNAKKYIPKEHKEIMIGISRIWQKRGKKIEILYNGQPCPDALKRFISEQALDEEDLEALEQHTEVIPQEISYFDPDDPDVDLSKTHEHRILATKGHSQSAPSTNLESWIIPYVPQTTESSTLDPSPTPTSDGKRVLLKVPPTEIEISRVGTNPQNVQSSSPDRSPTTTLGFNLNEANNLYIPTIASHKAQFQKEKEMWERLFELHGQHYGPIPFHIPSFEYVLENETSRDSQLRPYYKTIFETRGAPLGAWDSNSLAIRWKLCDALGELYFMAESETLLDEALQQEIESDSESCSFDIASTYRKLGYTAWLQGLSHKAEQFWLRALSLLSLIERKAIDRVAVSLDLASMYRQEDRVTMAEGLLETTMPLYLHLHPPSSANYLAEQVIAKMMLELVEYDDLNGLLEL